MKGQCKLCLKPNQELRKSHIIPEFMYQNIYDTNPKRYYTLSIGDNNSKRIEQKGIRENLFCSSCESILSEYEKYAAEIIYAKNMKNDVVLKKANQNVTQTFFLYEFENLDYKSFKLFEMSLLWRLIISSKYDTLEIGKHEEQLRKAIHSKNPMKYYQYGCLIQAILYKKGQIAGDLIINPFFTKSNDVDFMNILIDGFMYTFSITDKQILPDEMTNNYIQENGNMNIIGRLISEDKSLSDMILKVSDYYRKEINDFTK